MEQRREEREKRPAPIPPSVSGKLSERASSISTTGTTTEQQAYPVKQLKAA